MKPNYKQIFAKKKALENKVLKLCPNARDEKGIYSFTRLDDHNVRHFYAGQSVTCLSRIVSHLQGYDSHIDKSIRKWGLYDEVKNPYGYKIHILEYTNDLDEREKYWIMQYINKGFQSKNVSYGGQGEGKSHLNENKQGKGYYQGVSYGELKTKRKVKDYFDKYLDFTIKSPSNKIKERKYNEFKEWLNNGNEEK